MSQYVAECDTLDYLEDRLRKRGLPVDDVLRIGSEIAEVVEAAGSAR